VCGDFFFVHAGVRPGIPLEQQKSEDIFWIRDDFLMHDEPFDKMIVHGHTPMLQPDIRSNRINIDTGAYATGELTCLVLEKDEYVTIGTSAKRTSTRRRRSQSTPILRSISQALT